MSHWRRLNYSASLAVITAALAAFAYEQGGDLILIPGIVLQMMSELVLSLLLTTGDDFYSLPDGSHVVLSALCFFPAIYILSWFYTLFKEAVKRQ